MPRVVAITKMGGVVLGLVGQALVVAGGQWHFPAPHTIRSAGPTGSMLGTRPLHVLPEPPHRARPPHPVGQHRGRHVRHFLQQRLHRRLERGERRRPRRPLIARRRVRVHRLDDVVREIPKRCAIRAFGTPSAASLLINAQSSKVITLQSLSAHLSPPKLFSLRAPPTSTRCVARTAEFWLTLG